MKRIVVALIGVVMGLGLALNSAEAARRVGGGKSVGSQREGVTQRQAAPPAQNPSGPAAAAAPSAAGAAAAAKPGMGRWLAPLAGLAAGLGLAYLFGDQLGSLLMGLLLVVGVVVLAMLVMRMLARNRAQPAMQGAGAGNAASRYSGLGGREPQPTPQRTRLPEIGSGIAPAAGAAPALPAGFDADGFVRHAKQAFIELQAANDRNDLEALREMSTDEMYDVLKQAITERGSATQSVEVVTLNANLIEVVTEGNLHWASVKFSGTLREESNAAPQPFEEIWNLRKPIDGSAGWLLAGVQQVN
jgi:predicted lipid-binding transport protein (Tim44 family)